MQKLSMCRICLATDVRLCSIASHLRDMYEKVTELTFKKEDGRPLVACYICDMRLRNCYRLRTSCLQSEELLTEMLISGESVPQQVASTNTLRVVSVLHLSLGHVLQGTTQCHVKEEAPEVIHDAELDQQNTEAIKMEPQEEHDTQIDEGIQCSYLENPLDVIKREPDDIETDADDIKLEIEDSIIKENKPHSAYQSSLSAYNICPKIVKVVLKKTVLNDTISATGVPASKKLAETDSLLVAKPKNVNKSIVVDDQFVISKIKKIDAKLQKQTSESNLYSIRKCLRSKAHLESGTCSKRDLTRHIYAHTDAENIKLEIDDSVLDENKQNGAVPPSQSTDNICPKIVKVVLERIDRKVPRTGIPVFKKRFQCYVCNRYYKSKQYLRLHMCIHFGQNLVQCDVCNKFFKSKQYLTQHMHLHTDEKRVQCGVCNKYYWNKYYLSEHMYTHTDQKRFQCDVCSRRFTHKSNLNRHKVTHTDEKRFQCDLCNYCFREKHQLIRHINRHTLV